MPSNKIEAGVLKFRLAHCVDAASTLPAAQLDASAVDPMLDNGAPYSAIYYSEQCVLGTTLYYPWDSILDQNPDFLIRFPIWQYGTANQNSKASAILGSVVLSETACEGTRLLIRHLFLDGSCQ